MIYFFVFIKTELGIDNLALLIREKLNINSSNQTESQTVQKREGLNYGGEYYMFEFFGLELKLIKNKGEVIQDKYSAYNYYLMCNESDPTDNRLFSCVVHYLSTFLKKSGLETEVIEI